MWSVAPPGHPKGASCKNQGTLPDALLRTSEMLALQALHELLSDDAEVALLTSNNDLEPDDVPPWMAEKSFTFALLLDDGHVADAAEVSAFPTTWVLDRLRQIALIKKGWIQ